MYKELKSKLECEVIERGKSDKEVEKLKLELKELESVETSFKELQHNYVNLEKKLFSTTISLISVSFS
jgi:cell shape-determining protein MreC